MTRSSRLVALALILTAWPLAALAASLDIDPKKSQLTAVFRQMNVPVEGRFASFQGSVEFDPARPQAARAQMDIDTASFDVGAAEYNDALHDKEWFDTRNHPKARFVLSRMSPVAANRFEAIGTLTLKGASQQVTIPFVHRRVHGVDEFEGQVPISRKAYRIGSAEWDDTLEDRVIVKFRLVTTIKK